MENGSVGGKQRDRCKAAGGGSILPVYKRQRRRRDGEWGVRGLESGESYKMEDDFRPQVKKVAVAMGAALTEQDVDRMPHGMRAQGNFHYGRFLDYMRQFSTSEQREEAVRKAFATLDKDGSGYIEWNEIKYILSTVPGAAPAAPLSDEEAEAVMQAVDADGDGRINYREFSDLVKMEKKPGK